VSKTARARTDLADKLHGPLPGVLARPLGDDFVDLGTRFDARINLRIALVVEQILRPISLSGCVQCAGWCGSWRCRLSGSACQVCRVEARGRMVAADVLARAVLRRPPRPCLHGEAGEKRKLSPSRGREVLCRGKCQIMPSWCSASTSAAPIPSQLCSTSALSAPSAGDPLSRTVLPSMRTGQVAIL